MKKPVQSLWFAGILALAVGIATWGTQSQAQQAPRDQTAPQAQPGTQSQPPAQSAPDTQAQSAGAQTFSGTISKVGDKYVLKDPASGNTYDVDRQDLVAKYDGQKVRIKGTLESSGKMIQVK